ncbi:hypothetical protein [Gordonia sputi]|uniref:hypothetical protein n=1 Tax=Gordonia sputi TaxID=36823 RepID=UPI0036C4FA3B
MPIATQTEDEASVLGTAPHCHIDPDVERLRVTAFAEIDSRVQALTRVQDVYRLRGLHRPAEMN